MQRVTVKLSATKIKRPSVRAAQAVLVPAKGALCQTRALPIVLVSAILIAREAYGMVSFRLIWWVIGDWFVRRVTGLESSRKLLYSAGHGSHGPTAPSNDKTPSSTCILHLRISSLNYSQIKSTNRPLSSGTSKNSSVLLHHKANTTRPAQSSNEIAVVVVLLHRL